MWQLRKTGSNDRRTDRPNMFFPVIDPDGNQVWPFGPTGYESCWRFDRKGYENLVVGNYIVWKKRPKNGNEVWWPYVKTYLEGRTKRPSPLWTDIEGSKKASIDLRELLGNSIFDNPKPIGLLNKLLQILPVSTSEGLILDFFAGSGTLAQAVLELNKQNGSSYKFILIQLPEPTENKNYPTIAEITKKRVRCAITKLNEAEKGQFPFNGMQDRGFRVFKLAGSNFKVWDAQPQKEEKVLEHQLELHIEHIREGRSAEDILYEILLKSGFPLTSPVEKMKLEDKIVYSVARGALLICLEKELTIELIRAIAGLQPERVVCLDAGFANNDQLKANAVQIFKTRGIPSFKTV